MRYRHALLDGRTILQLADGLALRRARVMGEFRIELTGFTDGMVDRLKAFGLMSEIIAWKRRRRRDVDPNQCEPATVAQR